MQIAIEATTLTKQQQEGTGRYAQMLLSQLDRLLEGTGDRITRLCHLSHLRGRRHLRMQPDQRVRLWHDRWLPTGRYDVVHALSHRLPKRGAGVRIATIHDLYPVLGINSTDPEATRKATRRLRDFSERADHVICISESTRCNWLEHFPFDAKKVHVIHHGVDRRFQPRPEPIRQTLRARYSGGEPYLLFLGAFRPNKNIERLIRAYAESPVHRDLRLVIAGRIDESDQQRLGQWLSRYHLQDRVVTTGYFNDAELPDLYAAASGLLLPSLYEGFGLPILEAMACGVPVLTSTTGSCPEAAAGHATLVDPTSVEAILRGLSEIVNVPVSQTQAALRYAATKTWEETARQTLQVYSVATGGR